MQNNLGGHPLERTGANFVTSEIKQTSGPILNAFQNQRCDINIALDHQTKRSIISISNFAKMLLNVFTRFDKDKDKNNYMQYESKS